jgi:hypothetical protein
MAGCAVEQRPAVEQTVGRAAEQRPAEEQNAGHAAEQPAAAEQTAGHAAERRTADAGSIVQFLVISFEPRPAFRKSTDSAHIATTPRIAHST